jgi:hypothetical protein
MDTKVVLEDGRITSLVSTNIETIVLSGETTTMRAHAKLDESLGIHEDIKKHTVAQEVVTGMAETDAGGLPLTHRQRQHGSWSVYAYYGRSAGWLSLLLWCFSAITAATFTSFMSTYTNLLCYYTWNFLY